MGLCPASKVLEGMVAVVLSQFIDSDRFSTVFTTDELLAQEELPFIVKRVEKGQYIFFAEEEHRFTYHVVSGLVRLYLTSREGVEKTLFYHAANTQFGFQGFKRDRLTRSTAVAVTNCEVLAIDYGDLLAFCNEHTDYYLAYIEYLFQIMNSQTEEIANLSFENGVRRLAGLLQSLVVSDGATIPYTIDELASIIGAHRNTVTNSLSYLRAEGYVAKQQRPIVVADIEGLRRYLAN